MKSESTATVVSQEAQCCAGILYFSPAIARGPALSGALQAFWSAERVFDEWLQRSEHLREMQAGHAPYTSCSSLPPRSRRPGMNLLSCLQQIHSEDPRGLVRYKSQRNTFRSSRALGPYIWHPLLRSTLEPTLSVRSEPLTCTKSPVILLFGKKCKWLEKS
jgi:hypothetical protein